MIFASWLGTYADAAMVHINMYSFPHRPLAGIFPVNILFTLLVLPIATLSLLYVAHRLTSRQRIMLTWLLAAVLPLAEIMSEKLGYFVHSSEWSHAYSFAGCIVFSWFVWKFHLWFK